MGVWSDQGVRHISDPSEDDTKAAKLWIRENSATYEDAFDCAVDCAHDLGIFDKDQFEIDPKQDRAIPEWIMKLTESFFSGSWE